MPNKKRTFGKMIDNWVANMRRRQLSTRYQREARRVMWTIYRLLDESGGNINPSKWTEDDIAYIIESIPGTVRNKRYYFSYMKMFCERMSPNQVFKRMGIVWANQPRTRVRWLNEEEQRKLLDYFRNGATLEEQLLITLELGMGLRRVEVARLTIENIKLNRQLVHICGKGRSGGKWRTIPIHMSFPPLYQQYLKKRQEMIDSFVNDFPDTADLPLNLLIYRWGKTLAAYKVPSLDKFWFRICKQVGFRISHHDLRRTFGRNLYNLGVRVEDIMPIFGHETKEQTIRYLGLDIDDMRVTIDLYAKAMPLEG